MKEYLLRLIGLIKGELAKLKLFKFPNATIFGQPTIQDGQVSNFTAENYLQFPFLVDFAGRPWQIDCAFTTGADVSQQHNIFDSNFGLAFAFSGGRFVIALSSDGASWNLGAHNGTHAILPSTTYYVRISWDGTRYGLAYSTDAQNFIEDISVVSTASLYPKQIIIGKSADNRYIFNGSINMNNAMLTISGKVVWQGMDDAGLATRMAIDMSNVDEAGKVRINDIAIAGSVGTAIATKQEKLIAGSGIDITGNTISATGGGESASWELLIDYVVPTDIGYVTFTKGKNGQVFDDYKELQIITFLNPTSASVKALAMSITHSNAWVYANFWASMSGSSVSAPSSNEKPKIIVDNLKKTPLGIINHQRMSSNNTTFNGLLSETSSYARTKLTNSFDEIPTTDAPFMNETFKLVAIATYTGNPIAQGSRILIYGKK